MDQQTSHVLHLTSLALQEIVRAAGSRSDISLNSSIVNQINAVFKEVTKRVSEAHFPDLSPLTYPTEVLPQIKLALDILEHSSNANLRQSASGNPSAADMVIRPASKPIPEVFIGCSVEGVNRSEDPPNGTRTLSENGSLVARRLWIIT